ncbi:hypothetical protein [Mycobacterium uberis]|uniref:hypothetical protein n=1 Tax=Mycobacterium uberis TaxID=2162698 RepID=UPI003C7608C2
MVGPLVTWFHTGSCRDAVDIGVHSRIGLYILYTHKYRESQASPKKLFPTQAITDLKAFFGVADGNDLQHRLARLVSSTTAFVANQSIDTVPASRYVFRLPFKY